MFNVNQFKQRLREEREGKNFKQEQFAKLVGIARASASYYENKANTALPNAEILYKMANVLNISTDYLLGLTDVKTPDMNIKQIYEKTGLSEKVITFFSNKCVGLDKSSINYILESSFFISLINFVIETSLTNCDYDNLLDTDKIISIDNYQLNDLNDELIKIFGNNISIVHNDKLADLTKFKAQNELLKFLESVKPNTILDERQYFFDFE